MFFQLYEHILREYIYPWHGQISLDEAFVQEIRTGLRYASAILVKRVGKVTSGLAPAYIQFVRLGSGKVPLALALTLTFIF